MRELRAFNLQKWIEDHREHLKPPVCNKQIFTDGDFIIMVVGGPNSRKDFHYDEGDEFFYQLEGDMLLKTIQGESPVDIPIREGDVFLLPGGIPHSPQRFADTVGIVIERVRQPNEKDGFIWYCDVCHNKLHEEYLHISDIEAQLPPVFDRFYSDAKNRTCSRCGHVMEAPEKKNG